MTQLVENSIFHHRYLLTRRLGTGTFSEVWKATDQKTGSTAAIKIFAPDKGIDQDGITMFADEYGKTNDLMHPHILRANHFDVNETSPYLVLPYCKGGSLSNWIAKRYSFSEREIIEIIAQIADALKYIHQNKDEDGRIIIHQDIKPANILVKDERLGNYLLADFGISSNMKYTVARSVLGSMADAGSSGFTPAYAPPEINMEIPSPAGDIFSLGMTLLELIYGKLLPYGDPLGKILAQTKQLPELLPFPPRFSDELINLVLSCLQFNKHQRPTAADLAEKANYYLRNGTWQIQYSPTENINHDAIDEVLNKINTANSDDDTIGIPKASLKIPIDEEDTLAIPKNDINTDKDKVDAAPVSKLHIIEPIDKDKNKNEFNEKPIPPPPPTKDKRDENPVIEEEIIPQKIATTDDKPQAHQKRGGNADNANRGIPKALIAAIVVVGAFVGAWFSGLIPHGEATPLSTETIWQQTDVVQDLPEIYRQQLNGFYESRSKGEKNFHLYSPNDWTLIDFKMGTDSQKSLACILRNKTIQPPKARLMIWHPDQQGVLQLDDIISDIPCDDCQAITAQDKATTTACAASIQTAETAKPTAMTHSYLKTDEPTPRIIYRTKDGKLAICYGK